MTFAVSHAHALPWLALLPQAWFEGLHSAMLALIAVAAMAVVIKGADWLVDGAAGIALRLGMSKIVVGATVVSLGTTSPECAVSVLAAFQGNAGLALGNGVGSIIADTGLIFGLGCLLARLPADRFVLSRQGWVQFGAAAGLSILCYALYLRHGDGAVLGRGAGLLLLAGLAWYLWASVRWSRRHPRGEPHIVAQGKAAHAASVLSDEEPSHGEPARSTAAMALVALVGLVLVVLAGDGLVRSVSLLAHRFGVPDVVIASTIVAVGTSLPELVVGLTAIRKGHAELLVGNIIGADILNVLFVIGASATAANLAVIDPAAPVPAIFLMLHLPAMLAMLVLFRLYIFRAVRRGRFDRWMGWPLVGLYGAYLVVNYALGR